jgi:hypothetical protein
VLWHKLQMQQHPYRDQGGITLWTLILKIATTTGLTFTGLQTEYFHKTGAESAWLKTTLGTQLSTSSFTSL